MKLLSLHVRRFRSVRAASLPNCGPLNVLIGKNNAGKSNLLETIELLFSHLRRGTIAGSWRPPRPLDEFVDRDSTLPIQIGAELELTSEANSELRTRLAGEAPHLENAIEQIKGQQTLSVILACVAQASSTYMFIEQMTVGRINSDGDTLLAEGLKLLMVPPAAGWELFQIQSSVETLRADLEALQSIRENRRELTYALSRGEDAPPRGYLLQQLGSRRGRSGSAALLNALTELSRNSPGVEEALSALAQLSVKTEQDIKTAEKRQTEKPMSAFAGDTRIPPSYAVWLTQQYGATALLHLRETKQSIGRNDAEALLSLKIKRGGPERLSSLQQTIRALLGVQVDAFAAEAGRGDAAAERGAEMDIDEFLVEANGAGVREALRVILDLELKAPEIALVEEPEIHLHPGLERAIESYLRDKSNDVQMFVTTHSTNFVDAVSFQHVYLISRDAQRKTICQEVDPGNAVFQIPTELGLRLSSVFMYDQLVFVEGPSDEAVLRAIARTLGIDTVKANVGFVHMKGVRNFGHFAAESTLDVLSRRQIRSWFVVDRDEASDNEIKTMLQKLKGLAELLVLNRRELENYILDPGAVAQFIAQKSAASGRGTAEPSTEDVREALRKQAEGLKDEVVRLNLERCALRPVFLHTRASVGSVQERIGKGIEDLKDRLEKLEQLKGELQSKIEAEWAGKSLELAPGTKILEGTMAKYGLSYDKGAGDSARLAALVPRTAIAGEIAGLLRKLQA
jgi:putative ATP-dependent endonuclease of the OLD family